MENASYTTATRTPHGQVLPRLGFQRVLPGAAHLRPTRWGGGQCSPPAPPGHERADLLSAEEDAGISASASPIPARVGHEQFFHFYTGTNRNDKTVSDDGRTGIDKPWKKRFPQITGGLTPRSPGRKVGVGSGTPGPGRASLEARARGSYAAVRKRKTGSLLGRTWGLPRLGFCYKRSPQGPPASSWDTRGAAATGNRVAAGEMEQPGPLSPSPQRRALTTEHFNTE